MILAKTQIESGDFQSVLTALQQAFDLSGGNSEALAWKVFALVGPGELERAKEIVEVMKETAKTRHMPVYNLPLYGFLPINAAGYGSSLGPQPRGRARYSRRDGDLSGLISPH
jgi:cytochrome c-type biogenesis protein CcmH/NrfG